MRGAIVMTMSLRRREVAMRVMSILSVLGLAKGTRATAATAISPEEGGGFSIFGGVISGRNIEMVPNERLVQAWREKNWDPGVFTIVKFQLNEEGSGTRVGFDETAIPQGHADHLAPGWKSHYWESLQKYLA